MNLELNDKVNIKPLMESISKNVTPNVSNIHSNMNLYRDLLIFSNLKEVHSRYQEIGESIIWNEFLKEKLKRNIFVTTNLNRILNYLLPLIGESLNLKCCFEYPYTLISSTLQATLVKAILGLIFLEFGGECVKNILTPIWRDVTDITIKLHSGEERTCSKVKESVCPEGSDERPKEDDIATKACPADMIAEENRPKFELPEDFVVSLPPPGNYIGALSNFLVKYCPELEPPIYIENVDIGDDKKIVYKCEVVVYNKGIRWSGYASSIRKKEAKKMACKELLIQLTGASQL
ncbi:hypothetical protein K7432_003415 [Basidiobolus ranarum]|uniref:DRBM domain-containing protein n=1 Tax=Basidiobolus ranarum TaxID=34480 RepID=A0ABR2X057_9FUNG